MPEEIKDFLCNENLKIFEVKHFNEMKIASVKGIDGETKKIELPSCFETEIRSDLIRDVWRVQRAGQQQPYGSYVLAGKESVASGKFKHLRHAYKTLYGLGISRVPRQVLTRRGERFYWKGAFMPGTVGGRAAHPPKVARHALKINKKVRQLALKSAIAATASSELVEKRHNKKLELPIVIDSSVLSKKPKEIASFVSKLVGMRLLKKKIRAGKGKRRGRKYKKSRLLLIVSTKEKINLRSFGLEPVNVNGLNVALLAPSGSPGRIVVWTDKAIEELKSKKFKNGAIISADN